MVHQMATEHFGFDAQRDVSKHILNLVCEPAFKTYMTVGDFAHDVRWWRATAPGTPREAVRARMPGLNRSCYGDITAVHWPKPVA
jgi:hypothetical protein